MLDFADPLWAELSGGYGIPYDPRPALQAVLAGEGGEEAAWAELWNELHHQGDIGQASYAAVIVLAEAEWTRSLGWNTYAFASCVETERHCRTNPAIRPELASSYFEAVERLVQAALEELRVGADPLLIRAALALVALGRGATHLGAFLSGLDESEITERLEASMAWSQRYRVQDLEAKTS